MAVDLLVFGPHPDDLEIGLGGTIARHAALGLRVGLCDLTAGEMGSNGTVEERLAEGEAARAALGAAWRENLRWPDRRIGKDPAHLDAGGRLHPPASAADHRRSLLVGSSSRSRGRERGADRSGVQRRPAALSRRRARRGSRIGSATTSSTTAAAPSFVVDVSEHYERKRAALDCHASQFQRGASDAPRRG